MYKVHSTMGNLAGEAVYMSVVTSERALEIVRDWKLTAVSPGNEHMGWVGMNGRIWVRKMGRRAY